MLSCIYKKYKQTKYEKLRISVDIRKKDIRKTLKVQRKPRIVSSYKEILKVLCKYKNSFQIVL